jgi:error-prone DNA polymerase
MAGALARGGAFHAWEPDRRRAGWEALREAGDRLPLAPARPGRGRFAPRKLDRDERIALDYESLGLTAAGHPMERFRAWLRTACAVDSQDLQDRRTCPAGARVSVGGLVTVRQRPPSAKGTIFLVLEDEWGIANIVVSRTMDEQFGDTIREAVFLLVTGRVERDGTQVNVVGESFVPLRDATRRSLLHASHDFH